jgi:hypothetical protein
MATLLRLTSPHTKGNAVSGAQKILNGHNVFATAKLQDPRKGDYLDSKVDGKFGEFTERACKRAKYWLGYPDDEISGGYGERLNAFLVGKKDLPQWYEKRRRSRIKAALATPLREKALKNAIEDLNKTESPAGSNNIEFSRWYMGSDGKAWSAAHPGPPYCAMGATKWYVEAGSKELVKGVRYAYCPFIVADARAGNHKLSVVRVRDVKPGDLVMYDWEGNGVSDHVGLFEKWVDQKDGYFQAVEANTSPDDSGSQSNGGGVFRRGQAPGRGDTRRVSNVQVFVRVSG